MEHDEWGSATVSLALPCSLLHGLEPTSSSRDRKKKLFDLARSFFLIDDVSIKDRAKPLPLGLGLLHGRGVYLEGEEEDPKLGLPR